MRRLTDPGLSPEAPAALLALQGEVDGRATYEEQVAEADRLFGIRNRKSNVTFAEVRSVLDRMCPGIRRCCWCEDSCADEVEHTAPKSLYPGRAFDWSNYVYACGPCNGPKGSRCAVINGAGARIEVTRRRGAPVVPPTPGRPAIIDPRIEDPASMLELDIAGPNPTFLFRIRSDTSRIDARRAEWTIELLDLNRSNLRRQRENAFAGYVARLRTYSMDKAVGRDRRGLHLAKRRLLLCDHPTVFLEMQRQAGNDPGLRDIFAPIPEAWGWTFA